MTRILNFENNLNFFFETQITFLKNLFLPEFFLDFVDFLLIYCVNSTETIFWNYFFSSYYTVNFFLFITDYSDFIVLTQFAETPALFNAVSQISLANILNSNLNIVNIIFSNGTVIENLFSNFFFIFDYIFIIIIIIFFFLKWNYDYLIVTESQRSSLIVFYESIIYSWINFVSLKFESYDEALCVIIIWPWCVFLIFTHIFAFDNNESFFIFIEWGLPVIYGYLLLSEHIWNFGQYFFVYLNGSKGRRLLTITLIEDLVSFIIILSRVSLQVVRGLICGFFHDFFREMSEYLFDTWFLYYEFISNTTPQSLFVKKDLFLFFVDVYIIAFTLLFIYAILFLQLLFLVIAVWIFCRCWFISSVTNSTSNHKNFDIKFSNVNFNKILK
jgi:hypothetical protein